MQKFFQQAIKFITLNDALLGLAVSVARGAQIGNIFQCATGADRGQGLKRANLFTQLPNLVFDVTAQEFQIILVDWIAADEFGGHSRCSQLTAFHQMGAMPVADDEFDASAADVQDQVQPILKRYSMTNGLINQSRLVARADDAKMQ